MMNTLQEISSTLDRMIENQEMLLNLDAEMVLEKEALQRTQESVAAHLEYLKADYLSQQKHFSRVKYLPQKQEVYEKLLAFNRIATRPLSGYLPYFKESNVHIRKRRMAKVLVLQET